MSSSDSTTTRDRLLEECIERHGDGGDAAMEAFLGNHPSEAPWIRAQVDALRQAGLLDQVPRAPEEPTEIGDFHLVRKLGEGGMGVVYLAEQRSLGRRVALKLLRPGQLYFGGARERFRREVEAVARLHHPGIVPVHVVGDHNETPYFAMEYVEGRSLGEVLRSLRGADPARLTGKSLSAAIVGKMPDGVEIDSHASSGWVFEGSWAEACIRLVQQAAEALDHAHRRGVVHRDVKPSNLMVTPSGRVLLVDFGLATMDGGNRLTRTGAQLGSLPYLAPEQVRGSIGEIGPRTDVYGLGVTLYELLTLRLPYHGASAEETMRKILEGRPAPVRAANPNVSRDAETVCLTAMERTAARRYASAADLARDLANVLQARPIEARRAGPLLRATRLAQRHPAISTSITVAALAVVGLLGIAESKEHEKRVALEGEFQRSEGLRLAALAGKQIELDPGLALLLAIEAAERHPGLIANNALIEALAACREIRTLQGHTGTIRAARFSPDGGLVATAGDDCEVRLWDGRSGAPRAILVGHEAPVASLEFAPDGQQLASAGADGIVCLWTPDAKIPRRVLRGHRGAIASVGFSPDGALLASASSDGTVRVWNAESGEPSALFPGHTKSADLVRFSPNGTLLATAASDGTVRCFDVERGVALREIPNKAPILALAFDPRGERFLVAGRGTTAQVYSTASGELLLELAGHAETIQTAEFDPTGDRVLTGAIDNSAIMWDSHTGERLLDFSDYYRGRCGARWVPDGKRLVTFSNDRAVRVFDASTGGLLGSLDGHLERINDVALSADGARIVTIGENARLWRVPQPPSPLRRAPRDSRVVRCEISFGGELAAFPMADGTTRLLDIEHATYRPDLAGHRGPVANAAFSRDMRWIATFGSGDGLARIHDLATGECVATTTRTAAAEGAPSGAPSAAPPRGIVSGAFSSDGHVLALGSNAGKLVLWDWGADLCRAALDAHAARITSVVFSPDGARLATAAVDGSIRLWDPAAAAPIAKFPPTRKMIASVAFDREGRRLAAVGYDRAARIWNLDTMKVERVIAVDDDDVSNAQFSPDGKLLALAVADRTARLYDLESGRELARVKGFGHVVSRVAFLDSARVLAVALDGTARTFPTNPLAEARARKPRELTLEERLANEVGGNAAHWTEVKRALAEASAGALWTVEIVERLRAAPQLSDSVRADAVAAAAQLHDGARAMSSKSWRILSNPRRTSQEYERALRPTAAACEIANQVGDYQRGLGIAYLRLARFDEAILWLSKPECNHPMESDLERAVTDLALAYAHAGLGHTNDATAARARFEALRPKLATGELSYALNLFDEAPASAPSK